jgi:hypothetical protein
MKRKVYLFSFLFIPIFFSCTRNNIPYTQDGDWIARSQLNGPARSEAATFTIGNFTFLGTGWDGLNKRYSASTFLYQNKAYLVTGVNNGSAVNDFWLFDPSLSNGNWKELRHITNFSTDSYDDGYTDIVRWNASAFVITGTKKGDKAFLSIGENGSFLTTTWEYDFATDLWSRKSSFEGPATTGAVGFNVQNRGYIAIGRFGNGQASQSDRLWEFHPDDVLNPNNN